MVTVQCTGRTFRLLPTPKVVQTIEYCFAACLEGFDIDGNRRNDGGAVAAVFGRGAYASGIRLICLPNYAIAGSQRGENLGRGVTAIGDIDGDGCDDADDGGDGAAHA